MCGFDNWFNFGNWSNAQVTVTPAAPGTVSDGEAFDPTADVSVSLGGNYSAGSINQVTFSVSGAGAGDTFTFDLEGTGLTQVGNGIYLAGAAVASFTGGTNGDPLVISIGGAVSDQQYIAGVLADVIDAVRFSSNGAETVGGPRTITIGANTSSGLYTTTVQVSSEVGASAPGLAFDFGTLLGNGGPAINVDDDSLNSSAPIITLLPDGGRLITWLEHNGVDNDVVGRLYGADGTALGAQFLISTGSSNQYNADVALLEDGGFVVTWVASGQDGAGEGVYARLYDAEGSPAGAEFRVNTTTAGSQSAPNVEALPGGGFAVVWSDNSAAPPSVRGQFYDSDGAPIGGETVLIANAYFTSDTTAATVLDNGVLAVAAITADVDSDGSGTAIKLTLWNPDGTSAGSTITIDNYNWVGVYSLFPTDGGGFGLYTDISPPRLQFFDSEGQALTPIMSLDDQSFNMPDSSFTALDDGTYLLAWNGYYGSSGYGVYVERFSAEGESISPAVRVSTAYAYNGAPPSLVQLENGNVLITWSQDGDIYTAEVSVAELSLAGAEGGWTAVPIILTWPDQDGSETLVITLSGFPEGASFDLGSAGPEGTWVITGATPAQLLNLHMTTQTAGTFTLQVEAVTTESANGDTASTTASVEVTVAPDVSQPELALGDEAPEPVGPPALVPGAESFVLGLSDGGHAVAYIIDDGATLAIRRFDADGNLVSWKSLLGSGEDGTLNEPVLVELADGTLVALVHATIGGMQAVYHLPLTGEDNVNFDDFLVETAQGGAFEAVAVGSGYAVAWESPDGQYLVRHYDADSNASGGPEPLPMLGHAFADGIQLVAYNGSYLAAAYNTLDGGQPSLVVSVVINGSTSLTFEVGDQATLGDLVSLPGGGFAVMGVDGGQGFIQRYDADGDAVGEPILLSIDPAGGMTLLALANGDLLAVVVNGEGDTIAQRYDADGDLLGGAYEVADHAVHPDSASLLENGDVILSWTDGGVVHTQILELRDELVGLEDTVIDVPIQLTWPDQDGSETTVVTLSGFPAGATFSQGEAGQVEGAWVIQVTDPADLLALTMTPPANYYGDFTLTVEAVATESATDESASDTFEIPVHISDVSDAPPEITAPTTIVVSEDVQTALSGLSVADPDSAQVTVTLTVGSGTLDIGDGDAALTFGAPTAASVTISGSPADINAYLATGQLTYTSGSNQTADVTLNVEVSDGEQTDSASVTLDVQAVNDAPEISAAPTSISVTEDTSTAITGITVADIDSASLTLTLSAPSGALSATSGDGVTVGGTGAALTLSGTASAINAFIAASGVSYLGSLNSAADVTLGVSVSDGALTDTAEVTLDLQAVNDGPTVSAAASVAVVEDTPTAITGISLADVDSAGLTVTLSVPSGSLSATSGAGVTVGGTASALTLAGTASAINAFIAANGVMFSPAGDSTADVTLGVQVSDGALSSTAEVILDISAVNDAPEITAAPSSISVTEDTAAAVTGITVADIDSASLTVTLSVPTGALSATSGSGVIVGGTASALTLTGTAANLNAFIAASGVTFTPVANSDADVALGVAVSDGALSDSANITLDLQAVNDGPTLAAPATGDVLENNASPITGITVADIDSASLTLTLTASTGTLSAVSGSGVTVSGSGTGVLSLTGSASALNAFVAANAVSFLTAEDSEADVTLAVSVSDGALSSASEILLTVEPDAITGTPGPDSLTGDDEDNTIYGLAGADSINGEEGNDIIDAGTGDDVIRGGKGADTFIYHRGDGDDVILDAEAADTIVLYGYTGYTLSPVAGGGFMIVLDDGGSILLPAGSGMPPIVLGVSAQEGSESDDVLTGGPGLDALAGLGGDDVLTGLEGNDDLQGGDGDDRLVGGLGNDLLNGGAGAADKADYRDATAGVTVNLNLLGAQNTGGAGTDTLSGIEHLLGSTYNDILTGNADANSLEGKNGDDILNGGAGGDILLGGAGADQLNGGADLDYASYANALAAVGINLTTGVHTGEAAGDTFTSIERFRLSGLNDSFVGSAATDYAYGANGNDVLSGMGGIDRLYGQAGDDTLNGDDGNDILIGGAGADVHNGGAGRDTASYETMTAAVSINLTTGVHTGDAAGDTWNSIEILWLTAYNDSFTGGAAADEVRGAGGADTLNGADAGDILRGEDGADILNGDNGDDFLHGGAGGDQLNGGAGVDTAAYLLATAGVTINLTTGVHGGEAAGDTFTSIEHFQLSDSFTQADSFTGSAGDDWAAGYKGADTLNGMDGADTLNGGAHGDVLDGGAGADKLIGEAGDDQLTGGTGADQFRFTAPAFGNDTITDFENGVDVLRFTGIAGVDDMSDLTITQDGANVLITLPDGSTITLNNTAVGDLDASDFLWI